MNQFDRELGNLLLGTGAVFGLDEIAGTSTGPAARPPAAHIAGPQALVRRQRANDGAMLAMRADGDDDGLGVEMHGRA